MVFLIVDNFSRLIGINNLQTFFYTVILEKRVLCQEEKLKLIQIGEKRIQVQECLSAGNSTLKFIFV